jgi:hypothetical protein
VFSGNKAASAASQLGPTSASEIPEMKLEPALLDPFPAEQP